MEKYTNEIHALSQLTDKVEGKVNRSMRKRIAPRIHQAGVDFLARIHEECRGKIGATQDELEEEQALLQQNVSATIEKPELTFDYLKSIGREDMASW